MTTADPQQPSDADPGQRTPDAASQPPQSSSIEQSTTAPPAAKPSAAEQLPAAGLPTAEPPTADLPAPELPAAEQLPAAELPTVVLDCRGQRCPLPVIALAKRLPTLPIGATVTVLADDPAAAVDIPAWCRMRAQRFVAASVVDNTPAYTVQRLG